MQKTRLIVLTAFLAFTIATRSASAADTLSLTVISNKHLYVPNEVVYVSGSLMWLPHTIPVNDGLVGVEVRDPLGLPFILRTRPTGTITSQKWTMNFTQFYPCDSNSVPRYSFRRGETLYIFAEVKNFDEMLPHSAVICIVLYDANSVPIGIWHPASGTISPGAVSAVFFQSVTLSGSAFSGNLTLYAGVFSDFPKNGGYPYCPERTTTFTASTSQFSSQSRTDSSNAPFATEGAYDLSFKFPISGARTGNYTAYVSTFYYDTLGTSNFEFTFSLIGDINGDGAVDIYDAILLAATYNITPGGLRWDSRADLNQDKVVDIYDAILLASHYGESAL